MPSGEWKLTGSPDMYLLLPDGGTSKLLINIYILMIAASV